MPHVSTEHDSATSGSSGRRYQMVLIVGVMVVFVFIIGSKMLGPDSATLLTEWGDFDRSVWVCELALYFGLDDGTKAGFPGRIERIRKKQAQSHA